MAVRVTFSRPYNGEKTYYEFAGLSTDSKPKDGVLTGSLYRAVDTGKIYAYDETDTGTWYDQNSAPEE